MTTHWIDTPITADLLAGVVALERSARGVLLHRLPDWARAQWADPQLAMVEAQPSGVRLVFRTAATAIELTSVPTKRIYAGLPKRPDGIYQLCVDGLVVGQGSVAGGDVLRIDMMTGATQQETGAGGVLRFEGLVAGDKLVEIWLPHNETTELVGLRTDAPLRPVERGAQKTWLHHGSSISHGSNALEPTGTWPAVAARQAGLALTNLGFGGSALLDPFVARTMRDLPADRISLKLGINLVNLDLMRLRAFGPAVHGFLDTIREGHKETPLLVVSPILCPIHEAVPGPSAPDMVEGQMLFRAAGDAAEVWQGKLTLGVIRTALAQIVAQRAVEDPHIHYLDGRDLYGEADHADLPLPDRLHPDAARHRLMGERFAALAFGASGSLR